MGLTFLLSVGATVAGSLVLAALRALRDIARTNATSAAAVAQLAETVARLVSNDEDNRERIAALEGARRWAPESHPPWRT